MKFVSTEIEGLMIIEPQVYTDDRGNFFESFNENKMLGNGITDLFIQDNQSISHKNVLRGLHFQKPPHQQGKLVRVVKGSVMDVVVDLRFESKTFGRHLSFILDDKEKKILWIPKGFAHGFVSLEDETIFMYKVSGYYHPESESGIIYNDHELNINWKIDAPIVSNKDRILPSFKEFRESTYMSK
jgi:dTDP-4-dehydrorhamnose 3,5-epimerase